MLGHDAIARSAQGLLFFTETDADAERLADTLPRPVLAGTVGRLLPGITHRL